MTVVGGHPRPSRMEWHFSRDRVMVLPRLDRGIDRTIGIATPVRASVGRTMVRSSRTMTVVGGHPPAVADGVALFAQPSWFSPDLIGGSTEPSAKPHR